MSPTWPSPSRTIASPRASVASAAAEPSTHSKLYAWPIVAGSTPLTSTSAARRASLARSPRIDELSDDAGRVGDGLAGPDRHGVPAALRRDHVARAELLAKRVLVARQQRLAEDGDERDERQPDHQRGRRRRRAARIAHGVLLREPSGDAAEPSGGKADDLGEWANEPRCDRGQADEDAERAEADPECTHAGETSSPSMPYTRPDTDRAVTTSPKTSVRRDCRLTTMPPSRTAAIGGIRVARTAGHTEATSVTQRAGQHRDDRGPQLEHHRRLRHLEVDCAEERRQSLCEQHAEPETDRRGDEAEDGALEDDRAEHLPPRGAERSERRELLRPLRDRDRERVEDDEGADEERDAAEGEQEVADERDELADALSVLALPARRRSAPRPCPAGCAAIASISRSWLTPSFAATATASKPRLVEHLARGRDVEERDRGAAEAVHVAEADDPGERVRARPGPSPATETCSPSSKPCSSAVLMSTTTSSGTGCPGAFDELEGVEPLVPGLDAEAEGRVVALDRLPVPVEDLGLVRVAGEVEDRPGRGFHLGQGADASRARPRRPAPSRSATTRRASSPRRRRRSARTSWRRSSRRPSRSCP